MVNKLIYLLFAICIITSCSNQSNFFTGEILNTPLESESILIKGEKIWESDNAYSTGLTSIYAIDTFLVIKYSHKPYVFSVFNTKTLAHFGNFCFIGNGPSEFSTAVQFNGQFLKNNEGEYELYLYDINKRQSYWLNINKSVLEGRTISVISEDFKKNCFEPFFLNKDSVIIAQEYQFKNNSFNLTIAHKDKVLKRIKLNRYEFNEPFGPLSSISALNSKQNKYAMGMLMMNQINIIDLNTGGIKIIVPDGKLTEWDQLIKTEPMDLRLFFNDLKWDDENIYALYSSIELSKLKMGNRDVFIKVYDWDGNMNKQFRISEPLQSFAISKKENCVYGITVDECLMKYKDLL
ncbi:MAG: hypothetical protein RR555_03765 [Bacteroidales bacterium]